MSAYEVVDGVEAPRMSEDDSVQEVMECCRYGEPDDISRLVEILDASPGLVDCRDSQARTPMHMAAANGLLAVVCKLLAYRPSPNLQNTEGNTALHYAAEGNHIEVAKALLKHRWSPTLPNGFGRSPLLDVANRPGFDDMEVLLLKHDDSADSYQVPGAEAVFDVEGDDNGEAGDPTQKAASDDDSDNAAEVGGVDPQQQFDAGMDDIE
jgi:ankyrin repeat protein